MGACKEVCKPPAARRKKEPELESAEIQAILDNVPTIEAPDAPPKEEGKKFDWRTAGGGGNAGPPPMAGAAETARPDLQKFVSL